MRKNFTRFDILPFPFKKMQGGHLPMIVMALCFTFSSCNWSTDVFEKPSFPNQEWPAAIKTDIAFEISDTSSLYNMYIVLRHTDAYHFNNIYVRATVKERRRTGENGDYDLQLATNSKGWIEPQWTISMMPGYSCWRNPVSGKRNLPHTLEQLMREDPLNQC
jgi:gliding motility-associated lipoprotein GldH